MLTSLKKDSLNRNVISSSKPNKNSGLSKKPWHEIKTGDKVGPAIMRVLSLSMPQSSLLTKAHRLIKLIWSDDFLEGLGQYQMIESVKAHLRENVFSPQAVL